MKRFFGIIVILAILGGGLGAIGLYFYARTPAGDTAKEIHIPRGTSLRTILATLEAERVISNADLFRFYLLVNGIADNVRAGDYRFEPGMTPKQVAHALVSGDFKVYRFTIPEGWTIRQIAAYLERQGLTDAEQFLARARDPKLLSTLGLQAASLEGYLFPSTYEVYYPESPDELISTMTRKFLNEFTPEMRQRARDRGLTPHDVVTLASIVEKETGRAEERPLIASVFANRLRRHIPLQSDPTTIYGIPDFDGNLTRRHLETYTPYNTYVIAGLPPGPIASPGKAALLAVLYPAETDYLYFVSRNDGSHVFSKTLEEHNANVRKYQLNRNESP